MIRVVGKRGKGTVEEQLDEAAKGVEFVRVLATSDNKDPVMREGLSPFYLGPIECYDGLVCKRFERAWQCAKVFPWMVDANGNPNAAYFAWRDEQWARDGFDSKLEIRYPAGGAETVRHTLYQWWKVDGEFKKLNYIEGRKNIYLPLYAKAVVKTEAYRRLCRMRDEGKNILIVDYDGYNRYSERFARFGFTYNDVIHCPILKMGHGFVLAMLLEGVIKVENGEVIYSEGLMVDHHRFYPKELRAKTDAQKLRTAAHTLGVTEEEFSQLGDSERKWLRQFAHKENLSAHGLTKGRWGKLPLVEKLAYRNH